MKVLPGLALTLLLALAVSCGGLGNGNSSAAPTPTPITAKTGDITAVNHVVMIMQENRSFDHYFGFMTQYRQAHGIPINSSDGKIRDLTDPAAQVAASLNTAVGNPGPILPYHTGSVCTEDLTPDWAEAHHEMHDKDPAHILNAPMDGFVQTAKNVSVGLGPGVLVDQDGHRAMGIFDDSQLNFYYATASNFAMGDMFFSPIPTRTGSNRLYMHAATSGGLVHADTSKSGQLPSKTIWRALDEAGITWKIYISDWAVNHFTFFDFFSDSNTRQSHVVSIDQYFADVAAGTLPQVALIETGMATGRDEHPTNNPGVGIPVPISQAINVQHGAAWVAQIINALEFSPSWKDSVFFFAFDEGGGAFDHVPPVSFPSPDGIKPTDFAIPKDCFDQPCNSFDLNITGFRVPNFIVSPFAKKNYVSHTPMDYTAILKFIETRFKIPPLNARDAAMPDMTEFFDFSNGGPWATPPPRVDQRTDGVCDFTQE